MSKTSLKYRTFDQLFEEVKLDFKSFSMQNSLNPQDYIKVVTKINYDLGLRIHGEKNAVLEIDKNKVRLPDDFYVLNFAYLVKDETFTTEIPSGRHVEEIGKVLPCEEESDPCAVQEAESEIVYYKPCGKETVCVNQCGEEYQLLMKNKVTTHTYNFVAPLKVEKSNKVTIDCYNLFRDSEFKVWVEGNFLMSNFKEGHVYINYQGELLDDEGNLMVPDHPLLNEYYEYAIKRKVLENLLFDDEIPGNKIQLIEQRYREARNNALTVVNTPDYKELEDLWRLNRKAQYNKFYHIFKY